MIAVEEYRRTHKHTDNALQYSLTWRPTFIHTQGANKWKLKWLVSLHKVKPWSHPLPSHSHIQTYAAQTHTKQAYYIQECTLIMSQKWSLKDQPPAALSQHFKDYYCVCGSICAPLRLTVMKAACSYRRVLPWHQTHPGGQHAAHAGVKVGYRDGWGGEEKKKVYTYGKWRPIWET